MALIGIDRTLFAKTMRECRYAEIAIRRLLSDSDWHEDTCPDHYQAARRRLNFQVGRLYQNEKDNLIEQVQQQMREDLLEEEAFLWIKNGGSRAAFFTRISLMLRRNITASNDMPGNYESNMRFIYHQFDLSRFYNLKVDLGRKRAELLEIKRGWDALPNQNWVMGMNPSQLMWAKNYFDQNNFTLPLLRVPVNENSFEELQTLVVGILDACQLELNAKELFVKRIKNAWASKKNRENGKKTLSSRISPEFFSQLEELAEYHDCNKSKMLERLIKWKYQEIKQKKSSL